MFQYRIWAARAQSSVRLSLVLGLLPLLAGCALFGYVASVVAPQADVAAAYKGLAGQTVGVMIWADPGVRNDFENLQTDVAMQIQEIFDAQEKGTDGKGKDASKDLAGTRFLDPRAIVRWQQNHPELEGADIESIAPQLGVSRIIYVEIIGFETRSTMSVDLFRGRAQANIKVIEVNKGVAKAVFGENDVVAIFPPKTEEGVPASETVDADKIYNGTVQLFAKEIAQRFYKHEGDPTAD